MGYECPVCGVEEADDEHLANHVAFTALVRGGDHEAWLDDHVPDWGDRDPDSLAPDVIPHATETDSEPTTELHGHSHDHDVPSSEHGGSAGGDPPEVAGDVLEEARELTEAMYDNAQLDSDDDNGDADGAVDTDSENE